MDDKNVFSLGKIPSNKARANRVAQAEVSVPAKSEAAEREFVEAAKTHTVPAARGRAEPDWRALDPEERLTRGINVRFNDYELALLRHIAKAQQRSVHFIIKNLLMSAARDAVEQDLGTTAS
jgi:hypothetical protein